MNKVIMVLFFCSLTFTFEQANASTITWNSLSKSKTVEKEISWLNNNLTNEELNEVITLVSALSQPEASQLMVSHFYLDGSAQHKSIKPYLERLAMRPPSGNAGIIKVAYLAAKLHQSLIKLKQSNKYYVAQFSRSNFELPEYNGNDVNKKIRLSFDYQPAQVVLDILSTSDISYKEIITKISLRQFNELIRHRNQSFYPTPLTKEKLATCLQIASSTKPIDKLYRYINPYGLLNFTDVKQNLARYKQQINILKANETDMSDYINTQVSPYLPIKTQFSRRVSFFFINGADGWATDDVTALDLNYFKDNYKKLLPLLVHETYHSGQAAVSVQNKKHIGENTQLFVDSIDYLVTEGTATYIAPPSIKSGLEIQREVNKGVLLLEGIYNNTIIKYHPVKAQALHNKGIKSAGPFYWLGAEMSKVIVDELGSKKLAETIPYDGIAFFKAYQVAINKSNKISNLFSEKFTHYISTL